MKKLGKLMCILTVITALLCVFALHSSAATYSGSCGYSVNWSLDTSTGVLSITGTGAMKDYNTYPDYIEVPWSTYVNQIKSVQIQSGVTSIGKNAFYNCDSLSAVTIPGGVTTINDYAFGYCTGLTSVTIPSSVTSIGDSAFILCKGLKSITIPSSVTSIGQWAFYSCKGLKSITIPSSVTSIGECAFASCDSLTDINVDSANAQYVSVDGILFNKSKTTLLIYPSGKKAASYSIPGSVTSIGESAFYGCRGLANVTIPGSVTSIGGSAFYGCEGLSGVTIPDSVTSIGTWAFAYCKGLTSITIPSSVTSVEADTFYRCESLASVTIPSGVKSLGNSVFDNCKSLTAVSIPSTVTSIGNYAFRGCEGLASVTIPSGVKSLGNGVFESCKSLTAVTIPSGVTSIGYSVFESCKSLTAVTIPSAVTSIGQWAFRGCESLASITIPSSVTSIGSGAFNGCESLTAITVDSANTQYTSVDGVLFDKSKTTLIAYPPKKPDTSYAIPNSVTSIENCAFAYCDSLIVAEIPSSVTSIGDDAFADCTSLISISVDSANTQYTSVDGVLFNKGKTQLIAYPAGKTAASYTIPDGVTTVCDGAFEGCKNLKGITIPSSVTTIGEAFYESGLTTVTIPASVTNLYNYAFVSCMSLTAINVEPANPNYTSVDGVLFNKDKTVLMAYPNAKAGSYVVPDGVTTIYGSGFYKCTKLTSVSLPDGISYIDEGQFYGCTGLTDIVIPTSVKDIADNAFDGCNNLKNVFYAGSQAQWNGITIYGVGEVLSSATFFFNSTGHAWDSGTVTKTATCTADGEKVYKCTLPGCGDTKKEAIAKLGHSWDGGKKTKTETCTADGVKTYTCKRSGCGKTKTQAIAKLGHSFTKKSTAKTYLKTAAGCNNAAVYYYCCTRCTAKGTKTFTSGKALGHIYKTTTTKATTSKDGSITNKCTGCGKVKSKTVIYKATTFTLSTKTYTYDGKIKNPSVTVRDSNGKALRRDVDFTVTYPSNRSSVGVHNITVTFKGNYSGKKTLSFTIIPKATGEIRVTQTTTSVKATWSKVTGATGYKVYIYKGSKLVASKTVSSKTTSYTFKKLTAGTGYTVKVKTYQTVNKVNYWSSTESLGTATKPATPSMKSVKAGSKSATVKWSNVSGENGYQVYYATSKNGSYKKGATTKANDVDATIKKLTKGKTYYFKVRAYKTADSGTVYSAWSAVKSVKVK